VLVYIELKQQTPLVCTIHHIQTNIKGVECPEMSVLGVKPTTSPNSISLNASGSKRGRGSSVICQTCPGPCALDHLFELLLYIYEFHGVSLRACLEFQEKERKYVINHPYAYLCKFPQF
jgi:hypothetical protein